MASFAAGFVDHRPFVEAKAGEAGCGVRCGGEDLFNTFDAMPDLGVERRKV